MEKRIENFINELASVNEMKNVYNQYSNNYMENEVRRHNLLLYLKEMNKICPNVLLVGEAPGYHGCRFTGVPFTSEKIIIDGIDELSLLGKIRGYKKSNETLKLKTEATATIVWESLNNYSFIPLLWNAFPFHPHKNSDNTKNRAPNKNELSIGEYFLKEIIDMFGIPTIVAIGRKAEKSLKTIYLY